MSLVNRLAAVIPGRANRGCCTCQWLSTLTDADRKAFNDWMDSGQSLSQLWEICASDPDSPLTVSLSALRSHARTCRTNES